MLHIADKHAALLVVVPSDGCDFLLPSRREDREAGYPLHRDGVGSPCLDDAEVLEQPVQFLERRASIAGAAFRGHAESLGDNESILARLLIKRVTPCRFGDGENSGKV